jgi:uncharacterized protein (DUF433 family)
MPIQGLEDYSKEQLIEELINRHTFAGIVVFHRGDAKSGRLEPGEIVITKSPPLTRDGVVELLELGQSLVPGMFSDPATASIEMLTRRSDHPPLRCDEGGVIRIGKSRSSLDLIVEQYESGMSPEDMVRAYDTLDLGDVYAAIGFYIKHRDEVRSYLAQRAKDASALRQKIEEERPRITREQLVTRSGATERNHAPAGQ